VVVTSDEYKNALSKFATGITIITVDAGGELHGMTAAAFASVSLEPPLVLVCLEKSSRTQQLVRQTGKFAVNILSEEQDHISRKFSQRGPKPFDSLAYRTGSNGSPLIEGAIGFLECTVERVVGAGDHDVVIGLVDACETNEGNPLLYFNRDYRSLRLR
jgi:3-hydroxy-9,10-secoandrosta-1,3,5(10)-triene-9,17-dione monooxygenase reductase component